ncbi:MAG: peptidoglycan DD-metalloendopeptidase family protein [Proteobacteria bacterium]|nr:peptidoglycan DD-metalloendopeptidase family protein [Pseudomonadota bacterium]
MPKPITHTRPFNLELCKALKNSIIATAGFFLLIGINGYCGQNSDIGHLQKEAELINDKIEKSKTEIINFSKKESLVLNALNEQDLAIDNLRKNASFIKRELSDINRQIETINNESKRLSSEIEVSEHYVSKRLTALYKLNWLGRMNILASSESIYELFNRKMSLERILDYDKNEIDNLFKNRNLLKSMQDRLNIQISKQQSSQKSLQSQIEKISFEQDNRSKLLKEIRSKKSLELAAIKSLEEAAIKLDNIIKSLSREYGVADKPGDASLNGLESLKGLLNLPVRGRIISRFGAYNDPKYKVENFKSGIEIKTDRGEPIRAVSNGKIIYSGWLKGYGNMIIIDHGKNYYTVYAHLEETFKSKGDMVEMEEVIATAGDAGSLSGPGLYFEVRHHGKPIDPLEWIRKG